MAHAVHSRLMVLLVVTSSTQIQVAASNFIAVQTSVEQRGARKGAKLVCLAHVAMDLTAST